MNAILALQNLPETPNGAEEAEAVTTMTSNISVFSDCSSHTTTLISSPF